MHKSRLISEKHKTNKVDNSRWIDMLSEVADKWTDLSVDKNGHSTRKCLTVTVTWQQKHLGWFSLDDKFECVSLICPVLNLVITTKSRRVEPFDSSCLTFTSCPYVCVCMYSDQWLKQCLWMVMRTAVEITRSPSLLMVRCAPFSLWCMPDHQQYFTLYWVALSSLRNSMTEVFNLCHAVDPTEIPSSGGGPHGPRRTGFNLSYSWLRQNMSY